MTRERVGLARITGALHHALAASINHAKFETALLKQRMYAQRPDLALRQSNLAQRRERLTQSVQRVLFNHSTSLQSRSQALQLLAPARVLERGYSIVEHNGTILRDSVSVRAGDTIAVRLARGGLVAEVKSTERDSTLASDAG